MSARRQTSSPRGLNPLFLSLFMSIFIYPSYAYAIPAHVTTSTRDTPARQAVNFTRDFATAMGVAVSAVIIGTTVICVFAHCWRQILDRGRRHKTSVSRKKRLRKDEEAWFCGADHGLPMPQFDIREEPEMRPSPYYGYNTPVAPVVYARNVVPTSRSRSATH
ncbi:hypothetical protein F5Y12DRAFT_711135 [Xylaria sp. FL1777]|nr:hypothetical protein F5Y12DRAFT_711135 [Xylaria sp. FL1777]